MHAYSPVHTNSLVRAYSPISTVFGRTAKYFYFFLKNTEYILTRGLSFMQQIYFTIQDNISNIQFCQNFVPSHIDKCIIIRLLSFTENNLFLIKQLDQKN